MPAERVRRRTWRVGAVFGLVVALVLAASPAFAFRVASVSGNTQTFTQAGAADLVATYSSTGSTINTGAVDTWPWAGSTSSMFTPNVTTSPAAKEFEVFMTGCARTSAFLDCANRGTITLAFTRGGSPASVTNPILNLAGFGGDVSTGSAQFASTLTIATPGVTFGAPSAGATNLSVDTANTRVLTTTTRPSTECNNTTGGNSPNGTAGCGSVQLNGTFSTITFTVAARIAQTVGTGTFTATDEAFDTIRLNLTLQDEAIPTAANDTATTTQPTAVSTNVVANDTPVSGVPFRATNPVTFGNDTTLTTTNAAGTYTASGQNITFTPVAGFVGVAPAVTYRVTDVNGSFATATYTVTVLGPSFSCTGTIYRSNNTSVASVATTAVGAGAIPTSTFLTLPTTLTATTAMGISPDGLKAYFVGTQTGVVGAAVVTYTAGSATPFTTSAAGALVSSTAQIAGAVNPVNGLFYFGGTATASPLYMFNPTTGVTIQVGFIGGALASLTGDYAFTAAGDLLFLGGSTVRIIPAAGVPTTAGSATLSPTLLASAGAVGDGIAFGSDGYLYTQSTTTVRRTNPTTAIATATSTAAFSGTDMASCAAGSTVTVRKNLSARVKAADQFSLNIAGTGLTTQTATTSGATTGLQAATAGPVPVVPASGLTVSESAAGGTILAEYLSTYQCLDQTGAGTGLPSGSGASFALATSAASGQTIVCTFSNGPVPDGTGTIRVQKMLVPFGGTIAQATPAPAGWQFAASTSAVRTSIIAPASASTSAAGLVAFGVQFLSPTSSGAVTIAETQQDRYTLLQTGGFNASCVNEATGAAVAVANSGALGFTVTATRQVSLLCTVYNQRVREISCDNLYAYTWNRADTGVPASVYQVNTTTGALTTVAQVTSPQAYTNGLAVDAVSNTFWTADQNYPATSFVIRSVNAGTGAQTSSTSPTFSPALPSGVLAGALDSRTGIYYVGGPGAVDTAGGTGWIYAYNTRTSTWLGLVARLPMPAGTTSIADMALDGQGRLYYVVDSGSGAANRSLMVTNQPIGAIDSSVNAGVRTLSTWPHQPPVVGSVAFGPDGFLYLSTGGNAGTTAQMTRVNPSSGAIVSTTPLTAGVSIGDFGSCATPSTITLMKNLPDGRVSATDQFGLTISGGGLSLGNTGTTTGTETGVQNQAPSEVAGAVLAVGGGSYTISETTTGNLSNYATTWRCVDQATGSVFAQWSTGPPTSGTITMPAATAVGLNLLCTFTNTIAPVTVNVTKRLVDAQGQNPVVRPGWTVGATFAPAAGTTASVTPAATPTQTTDAAGRATWTALLTTTTAPVTTVNVREVQQAGYEFVQGSCVVTRAGVAQTPVTITNPTSATPVTGVVPGDVVDCTYANRLLPTTLTLVKSVVSGSALPTAWTLTATAPSGALPGPTGSSGAAGATGVAVTPAVPYALSESGGPTTYLQIGAWTCADAQGTPVPVAGGSVTVTIGTRVTCTVRNSTSTITLLKQVVLPIGDVSPATWNLTATPAPLTGLSTTTVGGSSTAGAANTFESRPGHTYTLDEVLADPAASIPYRFARLEVQGAGGTWSTVPGFAVTAPAAGQTAVYRFVNEPYLPPPIPFTGGGAADAYLVLGTLVIGSALVLVLWHRRRRRMT